MRDRDDLEPEDHSGDAAADPTAVDPDHTPDRDYRERDQEQAHGLSDLDR